VPFLRPLPMARVGVVGLKEDREQLLAVLHEVGLLQVEPISAEALTQLGPERASERQRAVGEALVRFRALLTSLPPVPVPGRRSFPDLDAILAEAARVPIDAEVASLTREADHLASERRATAETADLLERFAFYPDRLEWLSARRLLAFFGEGDAEDVERLRAVLPPDQAEVVSSAGAEPVRFIVAARRENAEAIARLAQETRIKLVSVPELAGPIAEEAPKLRAKVATIDERLAAIRARLAALSAEWYPTVATVGEALSLESEKFDLYNRLGAGGKTFALEGWVPARERARLEAAVTSASGGRAAVYDLTTTEEPPTAMENPRGVRFYEFFIRFYSLPQASEWDPTWIFAIAFPIFFGLMLGDVGYGLVILGFSLWMIAGFPGRRYVPGLIKNFLKLIVPPSAMRQIAWTLVPASLIAIGLGFIFNAFFGFRFLPGPPLLDPASTSGLPKLLLLAGFIGLAMVCIGFLLGAIKEYYRKHWRRAAGKTGGILFALGLAGVGLAFLRRDPYLPTTGALLLVEWVGLVAGIALLFVEGAEGVMSILEVVSHVLSYTRLVGILLASVILATVIDQISIGLFHSGGVLVVFGLVILVGGQIFNLVLGVFEPGIQGARLIFVEQFSKFYSGNGRAFRPFKAVRRHTAPRTAPAPGAP
jgi:V/A-type H+/Na+-transporting ATPase subunit I